MTRLFYEQMLINAFPSLQWVRVCTSAPFTITVYACDANLDLTLDMASKLEHFLSVRGMASCVHHIKHYFELQRDEAFPIGQIPECVKNEALRGNVTQTGVQCAVKATFPFVDPDHLSIEKNVVTFCLLKKEQWTPYQIQFVEMMLTEILPAGMVAKLSTVPFVC